MGRKGYGEGTIKYRAPEYGALDPEKEHTLQSLTGESIIVQIHNVKEHVAGTVRFYGTLTYQYILRENAAIPDEHEFGYIFTDGKEPDELISGKNMMRIRDAAMRSPLAEPRGEKLVPIIGNYRS